MSLSRSILLAAGASFALMASAQCTPDPLYTDSLFGVWPDTTENFVGGMVNVAYSDTLTLMVPSDAGSIDPDFSGIAIDSISVDNIDGLPPGISISCNSQTGAACTYIPGQLGCGLLEGIPTQEGTYELTIEVTAYAFFIFPQQIPYTFGGYSITVSPNSVSIGDLAPIDGAKVQNVPNPFAGQTRIDFTLGKAAPAQVRVFNLVGEEIWTRTVQGRSGINHVPFDAGSLESGIYLYQVRSGDVSFTGRMVVNR